MHDALAVRAGLSQLSLACLTLERIKQMVPEMWGPQDKAATARVPQGSHGSHMPQTNNDRFTYITLKPMNATRVGIYLMD